MKVHKLKTLNPFFQDVWEGLKDFEVRKNDRNFKLGDRLQLIEHNVKYPIMQPTYVFKEIKYILKGGQYGISNDYVILGLKDVR